MRNEELEDYYVYGTYVSVARNTNGYDLYFDDYHINLEVYGKQIIDYKMERLWKGYGHYIMRIIKGECCGTE